MFAILLIPFALTYTFGRYAGNQRQGWTIFAAMAIVLVVGAVVRDARRVRRQPAVPGRRRPGGLGNMEGKEVRFGAGARRPVRGRHDRHQHRRDQRVARQLPADRAASSRCSTWSSARSRPGGIGAGMYGMLVIGAILAVFIAGLMVGRTPEYLGKKVEAFEIKMAMLVALVLGASILGFTALAQRRCRRAGRAAQPGPARLQRDPVRLLQPDRQQRLGLRRPDRQHALLQHHRRPRDAHRPLRDDHPDPRPRRARWPPSGASRRRSGRSRPRAPVDRPADRRRDHRRRARRSSRPSRWARSSSSCSRTPERL